MNAPGRIRPPSRLTLALEGLGLFDIASLLPSMPVLMTAPRGAPQSVLVLPGLGADDHSTVPMRSYLSALGHDVHGWGLDNSHRAPDLDLGAVHDHIARLRAKSGRKVCLIGWSRGGILAREAARRAPDDVQLVVTLGSPFGDVSASNAPALYKLATGQELPRVPVARAQALAAPIPVPATAIYTKGDGIVSWRACLEQRTPHTENIAVRTTHLGIGFHPPALWAIADRLAQPSDTWKPFKPPLFLAPFFPAAEWP